MKRTISAIVLAMVTFALGWSIGHFRRAESPQPPVSEKTDTLYVRDTITLTEPIYVRKIKLDSVLVPVTDTLRMRDTLYVYLEREQVQWQDSLCRVYASGINPQVDSVQHFREVMQVNRYVYVPVKDKSRWSIGVHAGYGVSGSGLSPYVGVGISYNLLTW